MVTRLGSVGLQAEEQENCAFNKIDLMKLSAPLILDKQNSGIVGGAVDDPWDVGRQNGPGGQSQPERERLD